MNKLKMLMAALLVTFVGANLAMNENKKENIKKEWTQEELNKLDKSAIREILDGSVDEAAQFIKAMNQVFKITYPEIEFTHHNWDRHDKNRIYGCKSCARDIFFGHVTTQDVVKITKAHNECAKIFLAYCHDQIFIQLRGTEFAKIFIDAVTPDNLADVSCNLFFLVNQKLDKDLAQKFASYINAENITKINSFFLTYILKSDSSVVEMIAQNAITPDNIKNLSKRLNDNLLWDGSFGKRSSMLDMLLETNIKSEDTIIKNAITQGNTNKYLPKIQKSVERSKKLQKQRELCIRDEIKECLEQARQTPKEQWSTISEEVAKKILSGPQDLAEEFVEIANKKGATNNLIEVMNKDEQSINIIKQIEQKKMLVSKL